jgi:hypothetical protein
MSDEQPDQADQADQPEEPTAAPLADDDDAEAQGVGPDELEAEGKEGE